MARPARSSPHRIRADAQASVSAATSAHSSPPRAAQPPSGPEHGSGRKDTRGCVWEHRAVTAGRGHGAGQSCPPPGQDTGASLALSPLPQRTPEDSRTRKRLRGPGRSTPRGSPGRLRDSVLEARPAPPATAESRAGGRAGRRCCGASPQAPGNWERREGRCQDAPPGLCPRASQWDHQARPSWAEGGLVLSRGACGQRESHRSAEEDCSERPKRLLRARPRFFGRLPSAPDCGA
ncbi:PREDICTED: uncharacterized protein LOC101631447 isoform X1 [Condylura cristata]|uniref:uncharacterized protein LOC101631447 isoform X1 n=1 Tax=Condylura cristata TaxID=143302 RepID=UPI0006429A63|nr:PREDICTED: uncharacterized protein LOC101631447 isoform X1 [Condylura cristata]